MDGLREIRNKLIQDSRSPAGIRTWCRNADRYTPCIAIL